MNLSTSRSKNFLDLVNVLVAIFFLLFALLPLLWMVIVALRPADRIFEPVWVSPTAWTFVGFSESMTPEFLKSIWNSFASSLGATVLSMIFGVPAAFALARWTFKAKFTLSWLILVLRMAPPVGFAIPMFLTYLKLGLIDSIWGLILAYLTFTLPLVIWLMWMFFEQLPHELMEAAWIDGSGVVKSFMMIALPLSAPGLVASGILAFTSAWNDFFFSLILTRSEASTAPVAVMNFLTYSSANWSGIASGCLLLSLPAVPITFFMQKYIVQGITGGALKG